MAERKDNSPNPSLRVLNIIDYFGVVLLIFGPVALTASLGLTYFNYSVGYQFIDKYLLTAAVVAIAVGLAIAVFVWRALGKKGKTRSLLVSIIETLSFAAF